MYGNLENVKEGSVSNVLEPGIHKVHVKSLEVVQVTTDKYNGAVADLVLSDGVKEVKERIFPFTFNPTYKDSKGVPTPQDEQQKTYLSKHMHLFNKAVGEERYKQIVSGATSFQDYINRISAAVCMNKGGGEFKVMIIDKGGYSKYPMWTGGCAENLDSNNLVFDKDKYGRKPKPEGLETGSGAEASDDLPF